MKLKDLFKSTKTLASSSLDDIASELESQEYVQSYNKDKVRFLPNVDYSDPKNFAFFGSAEKYYTDAYVRIRGNYPYDGSEKEKFDWQNDSTFLDMYVFEHRYPRYNGYVNMGYPSWGTLQGSQANGYGQSDKNTFIKTYGGPHRSSKAGLKNQFPDANKLKSEKSRESNLKFKLEDGVTMEMWLKKPTFDTAKTEKEVLFDLWNGEPSSSAQYGRLRLELTGASSGSPFLLTAMSGTEGAQWESVGQNLTTASITDWTHIALSLKNSGSHIQTNLYINGALNQQKTIANAKIDEVTGSLISYIGALQTSPSASSATEGFGKFSGSIDEFRYWKAERTSKEIGRNYWTNIGAGTNTDEANTSLGVYYKFNEGITTDTITDATVLDYSGRVSNGAWTGYQEGARSTDSAIVLSNAAPKEFKDPTIYSTHPEYISTLSVLEASGSIHDIDNNSSLFNSMPSWILEEDDTKEGNLRNLTQVMGSFFDNMYLYIQESNSIKDVYAHFQTKTLEEQEYENVKTTSITGSVKPLPFADRLLTNAGFVAPELFADATIIEALADRAEDEHYEMKLHDVKNQIYQNVYSVLTAIYKSKGSKKSFRNVLHAFGVDEDVVKINMYADNVDFEIGDKHNVRARKEKFIDFNHPDRFIGSIYQYASGTDGVSFISGSESDFDKYIPITLETQVILPNKLPWNETHGFSTPFAKSVIVGMHRANPADGTDYTVPSPDYGEIQIYSERDELESRRVRFHMSSSVLGVHLSSSLYDDQYLNNEWLLAFKLKYDRHPTADLTLSSSIGSDYTIEFVGYNTDSNTTLNSFEISSSVSRTNAHNFLSYSKRIYAGAHYQNFTGSLLDRADHKIGFVRYWLNDLSNDVLLKHANDSANYGAESPFKSAYLMEDDINDIKVPEIDTLLLHWDFETLSTSDNNGEFHAIDVTSGSGTQRYVPAFESLKRKFYHGKGDYFMANDHKVVDVEYINSSRITAPELLSGDDMIEIRTQDDLQFTRNTLPQDYFIAFEKSMSQTISEEMINFMSSITAFNELIGRPVDRYRMEYKDLSKLRQLFFERITGELDLDKYIDYYKWLDDALGEMLVALVPASIKHSDGVNNVIENHIFSRDKYQHKYPTIEFIAPEPEGCMNTINRHLYPWKTGHAAIPLQEDSNCFWWLERAERTATGNAVIQPSQLPANSIHVTVEGDVLYNFSEAVSRVQIDLLGLQYAGFSQIGTATSAWSPAYTPNVGGVKRIIIFQSGGLSDFSNNIPAGSGILIRLTGMTVMPTGEFGTDPVNSNFFRNSNATGRLTITYASLESLGSSTPSVNTNAGILNTRQKVFQARNSQLRRSWCTAQHFAVDRQRHLHGGINYEDNKRRDYIWSATREAAESPLDYREFGGFPLRYVLTNSDMFVALNDCDDERPVTEKIKRAFGAYDGFDVFHHYLSGSDDGVKKGGMVVPFNIMSSSVKTGYTALIEGKPGVEDNIDIVNVHSDTIDNTNAIPLQSPFTERWVGGHQSRHAPINQGSDNSGSRGEGYKILINKIQNESGSVGIVGPDYPEPYSSRNNNPHMYLKQAKARYFREERAKRPLNIRNIQTTGSQVGNYQKNYQFVHTFGRYIQKSILNDLAPDAQLHNATNANLPQTTQEASLIARSTGSFGNTMSNFNTSSLYLGDIKTGKAVYADHEASGSGDSIIVNRFSAPGGFDTMSEIFLDLYSKEKSSYNALPFRNLQVRRSGSGEQDTIRVIDIHGNRYGLMTHLTRHSAQFGIDSALGGTSASYHKTNRNSKWDAAEESYDYDNWWMQHQIPQSDYQYKWVKSSHTASYATSSLAGHILSGHSEPTGTSSRYPIEHVNNTVLSQSGLNVDSSGAPIGLVPPITGSRDQTPYGYPSWEQIRNNDRNINIQIKKAYGYRYERVDDLGLSYPSGTNLDTSQTVDESRVTENIPNTIDLKFRESDFEFKYPYVNMRYHFDNKSLSSINTGQFARIPNESMYESLYGYYSQHATDDDLSVTAINIKQIVFPQYIKHTKFFVRHRHFFASHFWTDGENDLYQTDINETGSYFKVDEVGRRETAVTAAFWPPENLTEQTLGLIDDGLLTNIIPSQSIWSMDSRTYFTGGYGGNPSVAWDHHAAASNSAGSPGVLQSQDHHFHNDLSHLRLIQDGSPATGSFKLRGATRFGTAASGAFSVHGVIPTGVPSSGSFQVTSSHVPGTPGTGQFTAVGAYQDVTNSTFEFTSKGRTVLGTHASASFIVSGSQFLGSPTIGNWTFNEGAFVLGANSTGSFTVSDTRQYVGPSIAQSSFKIKSAYFPDSYPEATFEIDSIHIPSTETTSTFTIDAVADNGWGSGIHEIRLHMGNGSNAYNSAPTVLGQASDSGYVAIKIGTQAAGIANTIPSVGNLSWANVSNDTITVRTDHGDFTSGTAAQNNTTFWNHIRDIFDDLSFLNSRSFTASRSNGTITVDTAGVGGRGNTHFITVYSDPGNCLTTPSNAGGAASAGVLDTQDITIPYFDFSTSGFRSASFEVDTSTGANAVLSNNFATALPGLSSSAQQWQNITIRNDTEYFDAVEEIIEGYAGGDLGENYNVSYTTAGSNPNVKATFKLVLKEAAIIAAYDQDSNITSGSWDNILLTAGENGLTNTDFDAFVQACGSEAADEISINLGGTTKYFRIVHTAGGISGQTTSVDATGKNNSTWFNDFETAIDNQLPNGYSISKTTNAGGAGDCDDTATYTLIAPAGAYNFNITTTNNDGSSFANITNTPGAAAYGFGSVMPSTLSIGGSIIAQAGTNNNGINVNKNQSQSNIITHIIASIHATAPGSDYNVTSNGAGNSREFRLTASAPGTANNRTMTGAGQFSEDGDLTGGTADSGLGVASQVELRIRKGTDYASAWTSSNTADAVHIEIGTVGTTTSTAGSYSANPVIINVTDNALNSDSALYTKIAQAIQNHSAISITNSAVHNTNQVSLTSSGLAGGNTNFYYNATTSQVSRASATGGDPVTGSVNGHTLTLGSKSIILDNSSPYTNNGNDIYVQIDGIDDATMWADLESQINSDTDFTVASTATSGVRRTFNLRSDNTGSAQNGVTVASSDVSFDVTEAPNTNNRGTNETGATDGHYMSFFAHLGQLAHGFSLIIDKDDSNTNGLNYSSSVAGNAFTSIYVDSTRANDTDFWNAIRDAIESEGSGSGNSPAFECTYTTGGNPTSASFVITNYITGTAGNGGGSGNGGTSGNTFAKLSPYKFAGGAAASGAEHNDTITIHGQTITVKHSAHAVAANREVDASDGVSNATFWGDIESVIDNHVDDVEASRTNGTFTVTTTARGSSQNPNISAETGTTFTINSAGTNGTDESGAENGDWVKITDSLGAHTLTINTGSAFGTGSTTDFHNALTQSIKNNTLFDTCSIDALGGGQWRVNLTSSVTGTAQNNAITAYTQGGAGDRLTFTNPVGTLGGTDPLGIEDLDYIRFADIQDSNPSDIHIDFKVDTDNNNSDTNTEKYIKTHAYTGTDAEKSIQFWDDLSASIKTNTTWDDITITTNGNIATFHITSSVTGSAYNSSASPNGGIMAVYEQDGSDFAIISNTAGGSNMSGSVHGDTLEISNAGGQTIFTIVTASAANTREIYAGISSAPITDTQFFNNVTASIIANVDYDIISYTEANDTGSFSLTSSNGTTDPWTGESYLTGTDYNGTMTVTGSSFHDTAGPSGGVNGVFSDVKFLEIIPQPRYNYPHALTSPGSVRCPTDKSNLGLIHQMQLPSARYRLRSNHFALTRSLGYHTDGLYDNTSRFDTPDLSGLVPFDDHYDTYYERFRGHNKHHALVPEFRMSSHVKNIITSGNDELAYFSRAVPPNYWLELTGASLNHGESTANNKDTALNMSTFNREFTVTSKIKNMEKFISDNVNAQVGLLPYTLTLTCEAIKQLLPYEGFYPQTRTVQMAEAFANSYARNIEAAEADPNDTILSFPDNNPLAQSRPVFDAMTSPGLLYNTIKSGIAVDYPIIMSKMGTASAKDPYGGTNYMVANEYFEDRLPFETLLNPQRFMEQKYIVDLHPHPSSSFNLKAKIGAEINSNYKLMAQNFFAESMEFFLDQGQTSKIISMPDTDPSFGIVVARHDGVMPTYRGVFKVYKSKKQHPYLEVSSASDIVLLANDPSGVMDLLHNRPPSGTNYFLNEYVGLTGADLEYDVEETNYPRPNMNPFTEVGTITMYSQPNAFGPPCAGGVAVQFSSIDGDGEVLTGDENNTTYMMYDSTNGYNAPYTPPYYDGEAWAIYTFKPTRTGKHGLNEILENTTVEFLRYEVNHESGAYGDRGTFGPQGFTLNENAMQADASFNLFKKGTVANTNVVVAQDSAGGSPGASPATRGTCWVIESKYETPILDFSKYLNREYNAEFEADVTTADIHTASLSLSGTRQEPDILSSLHPKLRTVHDLSGILNPIGMWHQHGNHPIEADRGIFMQMTDMTPEYIRHGSLMTCPNPKYTVVKPDIGNCDGSDLSASYTKNASTTLTPYVPRQVNKRRLLGDDEYAVLGGAIQVVDAETDLILDTELRYSDLQSIFGYTLDSVSTVADNFKFFNVFRDETQYTKAVLTSHVDFTSNSQNLSVYLNSTQSADYNAGSVMGTRFAGNFATSYYNYDRHTTYAPLMIITKNYNSLSYDYDEFSSGFFEDFLKDFSIGIPYSKQSTRYEDAEPVTCYPSDKSGGGTVLVPSIVASFIDATNKTLSVGNLSKIDLAAGGIVDVLSAKNLISTSPGVASIATPESILVNSSIAAAKRASKTFSTIRTSRKLFRLIPPCPAVPAAGLAASDTASYSYPEPQFVRATVRYNAGAPAAVNQATQLSRTHVRTMPQAAPQNDNNITSGASTIRWGQFMRPREDMEYTKSLAELVGFDTTPVKMGVTAKTQTISEAVVAIPYIAESGTEPRFIQLDHFDVNRWMYQNGIISEDRTLLPEGSAISQEELDARLGEADLNASIIYQIEQMQRYVFPPHIDFINYDVTPMPMYIFEFTENLERDDLTSIWQGVMPETLKSPNFDTKSISHVLSPESLLGKEKEAFPDMSILKDIKWRVFKVKQKAKKDYDRKMTEDLMSQGLLSPPVLRTSENLGNIGYNWPYDYCSVVEEAQISVDIQLHKLPEPSSGTNIPAGADAEQIIPEEGISILDEPIVFGSLDGSSQTPPSVLGNGKFKVGVVESIPSGLLDIVYGGRETDPPPTNDDEPDIDEPDDNDDPGTIGDSGQGEGYGGSGGGGAGNDGIGGL